MLNRSKLYAMLLLLAAFTAGGVVGGAASAAWGDRGKNENSRRERRREHSYADRLQRELQLTQQQRDSVQRILVAYQQAMRELWNDVRPRMNTVRAEVREDISGVLDEAQQDAYDAMNARSDRARAAREQNGRGRGGRHAP